MTRSGETTLDPAQLCSAFVLFVFFLLLLTLIPLRILSFLRYPPARCWSSVRSRDAQKRDGRICVVLNTHEIDIRGQPDHQNLD